MKIHIMLQLSVDLEKVLCLSEAAQHFFSMNDKHSLSVGEPDDAVVSLDWGHRVLTVA